MKYALGMVVLFSIGIIVTGSPIAGDKPLRDFHYEAPDKILPMSFAHDDHLSVNCIDCHHNYVDDTGGGLCMQCHVTDPEVWPLLEYQFHDLCRGCHEEKSSQGDDGGPPRECMACHLGDDEP